MTEGNEPTFKVTCLVCGRFMTFVRTIGPIADDVSVFECAPCGFSMTQSRTPLMKQGNAENRTDGAEWQSQGANNSLKHQRGFTPLFEVV